MESTAVEIMAVEGTPSHEGTECLRCYEYGTRELSRFSCYVYGVSRKSNPGLEGCIQTYDNCGVSGPSVRLKDGLLRELNLGRLAPQARIIPLDQAAVIYRNTFALITQVQVRIELGNLYFYVTVFYECGVNIPLPLTRRPRRCCCVAMGFQGNVLRGCLGEFLQCPGCHYLGVLAVRDGNRPSVDVSCSPNPWSRL